MSNLEKLLVGTGVGGAAAGMAGLTLKARKAYLAGKAARMGARKRGDLKQQTIDEINQVRKADGRQQITSDVPVKTSSDLKQQAKDQINQARKADGRPPLADEGLKRGGRVKKMAHGGSVKSSVSAASKRGDGIALRGKTRGKIY
jgi:gas vesicle protein